MPTTTTKRQPLVIDLRTPAAPRSAGRSKYHAKAVTWDGIRFPSQRECGRYRGLCDLRAAGEVLWFARQARFDLEGGVAYLCDFIIHWRDGHTTVEDVKGVQTPMFRLKRKQVEARNQLKIVLS